MNGIAVCSFANQGLDRGVGLVGFILDVNPDIHFARYEYKVFVPQETPDILDLLIVPGQVVESGFAIQPLVTEQGGRVGNLIMLFETAQGVAVSDCTNLSIPSLFQSVAAPSTELISCRIEATIAPGSAASRMGRPMTR